MIFPMSITTEDELCHYCHLVDSHERVRGRREMDTHDLWQCTNIHIQELLYFAKQPWPSSPTMKTREKCKCFEKLQWHADKQKEFEERKKIHRHASRYISSALLRGVHQSPLKRKWVHSVAILITSSHSYFLCG